MKINKDGREIISLNKDDIFSEIEKKYKDLIEDNGYKYYYFNPIIDNVINFTSEVSICACNNEVKNKAVSWILIPGISIKNAIEVLKKDKNFNINELYLKFTTSFNRYLLPNVIPKEITTNRLF